MLNAGGGASFASGAFTSDALGNLVANSLSLSQGAGAVAIANGVNSGIVAGLALPVAPIAVLLTVQAPSGGLTLAATIVGAPTTNGFSWQLSGLTPNANYLLNYLCIL